MKRLREITEKLGHETSGSDLTNGGHRAENVKGSDMAVYTSAVPCDNEELVYARANGIPVVERAEYLGAIAASFEKTIAVAGTHGKTTTTGMLKEIFASRYPCVHIGGELKDKPDIEKSEYFITEACEYKKNLLEIRAETAVLLNIDRDHMECYDGMSDLVNTFRTYCEKAETAIVCSDNDKCKTLGNFSTFGIEDKTADYRAIDLRQSGERYSFTVSEYGKSLCRVHLKAAGKCNVYNALAAFAAMRRYGFDEKEIVRGLENFVAVKRRFECIGSYSGASFICDYAHHPREISATVATAEKMCTGKLYTIFQPHTYSRTKLLMEDFVRSLRAVPNLMIYKTYPAREYFDEEGSALTLAKNVGNCLYSESIRELKTWLKNTVQAGDIVLFLGAGDIYYAAQHLLKELNK